MKRRVKKCTNGFRQRSLATDALVKLSTLTYMYMAIWRLQRASHNYETYSAFMSVVYSCWHVVTNISFQSFIYFTRVTGHLSEGSFVRNGIVQIPKFDANVP